MIRFRNPGTEYNTQIQVIKQLYSALKHQNSFSLDDMAVVIAKNKLMTAYGYAGDQAIELSNTDQESLNSTKMNAKMYAEVFRMLGWVTPFSKNFSYPLSFTYLGIHMALSTDDCLPLYEQCVLGINNPTQLTNNMSYSERIRFFKCALRTIIDLGGIVYKHELCLGPMSIDDQDEQQYEVMINYIKSIRGDYNKLRKEFSSLAQSLGMKETPVDNCTRLPIAFMKSCGWVEKITDRTLYNKSMECLKITDHGRDLYKSIKDMVDLRLDDFETQDENVQNALIRIGTYQMLKRSGYDISLVENVLEEDDKLCEKLLDGKDLLFSACQTIRRDQVETALGIQIGGSFDSETNISTFVSSVRNREKNYSIENIELNLKKNYNNELINEPDDYRFLSEVNELMNEKYFSSEIVDILFKKYKTATQTIFYPLISTLFKIMGFTCSFSRAGDNGSRWDAIIEHNTRSVPIEIKSPTEEMHLSIKAIRQALENKIILLSRKTFVTDRDTTSLAVGYFLPNERAEVNSLINDIKSTFGFKIGVIDLKSLLSIAISILIDGKGVELEKIFNLEGLSNASI